MTDNAQWPEGLSEEIAVIDTEINDLETYYGVQFARSLDDLDYFKFHVFKCEGAIYALMRYEGATLPGVTLVTERGQDGDPSRIVAEALRRLGLQNMSILWQRDVGVSI